MRKPKLQVIKYRFLINNLYYSCSLVINKKPRGSLDYTGGRSIETAIEEALINALLMRKLTYIHFIINPADLERPGFHEAGTRCHAATAPINLRAL